MKWSIFKYALCAGLMLIWFSPEVSAQQAPAELNSKYDKRVHRYRRNWEKLIPTHTKIQFAGNMGLLYFNTVFGNEFWVREPDRYPKGYYNFSSKIRSHIFLGQRLTYDIDPKQRHTAKAITVFYELSTCDLYLISAVTNRYLRPRDYLSLSFGLKLQLF